MLFPDADSTKRLYLARNDYNVGILYVITSSTEMILPAALSNVHNLPIDQRTSVFRFAENRTYIDLLLGVYSKIWDYNTSIKAYL